MTNDSELKQAVLAELNWEPRIVAAHIGVTANGGVITLSGHVENYAAKSAAEAAAGRVKGVKAVAEELEVRLPIHFKRDDDEIAAAAIERLAWSISIPKDAIKVKVEKGWVTLTGEVEWHYQSDDAVQEIRNLAGVVGVSDETTIRHNASAKNIGDDISKALHRSWYDPRTIRVTTDGGRVELSGTVHSWHDREEAGMTAWAAPGATSVENNITVN
jgi:osmotically-inducible protein OsmY